MAKEKEKQEQIRMGLIAPPPPKCYVFTLLHIHFQYLTLHTVKLANMVKVLSARAAKDPTKLEMEVRGQIAERKAAHEKANADRKLTSEQRHAKIKKKLVEGSDVEINVALYKFVGPPSSSQSVLTVRTLRVGNLRSKLNRTKIDLNAKQLYLTGCVIISASINLVVVEGSYVLLLFDAY